MSAAAVAVVVIVLGVWLLAGIVLDHLDRRARDLDELESHRSLMRELRRRDRE